MKLTKEDMDKAVSDFAEAIEKYKLDGKTLGEYFITPDNSIIDCIYMDKYSCLGIIIDSPIKQQIGFVNHFRWSEVKATKKTKCS